MINLNLYFDQGTDWSAYIVLTNPDQTYINIANYTFTSQFKTGFYSLNVTSNLVCTIVDAANGNVELSLDAANTANIIAGKYVYDVFQVDTNSKTSKIQAGTLTIVPSVTGITPPANGEPGLA